MIKKASIITAIVAAAVTICVPARLSAQYQPTAAGTMRSSTYQQDTTVYDSDTSAYRPTFSVKRYFNALSHKDSMNISHMFWGAAVLPGTAQIYNRDYWKLPVVWGTFGGSIAGAVIYNQKWKKNGKTNDKNIRDLFVAGALTSYWGQLMDGVGSYKSYTDHLPARASLYSALLPGLGQAYNGDYWHIPIYYAGFTVSIYCWSFNQKQYKRYKRYYLQYDEGTYTGNLSSSDIVWYRDNYRRNRDYSVVATIMIYVLNIIDANVFAHFQHFDITDDISFNVQPAIISPYMPETGTYYGLTNSNAPSATQTHFGFQMSITF